MVIWLNEQKPQARPLGSRANNHHYRRSFLTQFESEAVVGMKSKPLVTPPFTSYKAISSSGRCCTCMQRSSMLCNRNYYQLYGWKNILTFPTNYSRSYFRDFYYCFVRNHSHNYLNLRCNHVEELGLSDEVMTKTEMSSIVRCMKSVETAFSKAFIRFVGYLFFKMFPIISRGIIVDEGRVRAIKEACNRLAQDEDEDCVKSPCVFLPLHHSHLDYLILALVAFCFDFPLPYVGAGNNLDIPIVKWAIKLTGGFFIKRGQSRQITSLNTILSERSFANLPVGQTGSGALTQTTPPEEGDAVSKAVLRWTLKTLLSSDQSVEFYIEGTRTRSGRPCSPRTGLLSLLVDCLNAGDIPDVCIIPTCLTYERVWELDDLVKEQLGQPKAAESLWSSVKAAFTLMRAYCGLIRVDFGEPFSLREFIQCAQRFDAKNHRAVSSASTGAVSPHIASVSSLLAQHVIFDCSRIAPITLTHAVAFLLLRKFRVGEEVATIGREVLKLRKEIIERGYDVTYFDDEGNGISEAVIYAAKVLNKTNVELVLLGDNSVFLHPSREMKSVLTLNYYAARVVNVYAAEAVVATAFVAATKLTASKLPSLEDTAGGDIADTEFRIDQNVLLERAEVLARLLCREFIFHPSCRDLNSELNAALNRLFYADVLRYRDAPTRPYINPDVVDPRDDKDDDSDAEDKELGYFGDENDDDDDDDVPHFVASGATDASLNNVPPGPTIELNLMNGVAAAKWLLELQSYLLPILEAQWVTACNLTSFAEDPTLLQRDREFITLCQRDASGTFDDGNVCFAESASVVTLSNALKIFEQFGFVKRRSLGERNGIYVELGPFAAQHADANVLEGLISLLEYYRVIEGSRYPVRTSLHYSLIDHILKT